VEPVLKPLWHAYQVLKRGRDKRQPLDLDMPERKILLTPKARSTRSWFPSGWMRTS
jgi:ribonuclease R